MGRSSYSRGRSSILVLGVACVLVVTSACGGGGAAEHRGVAPPLETLSNDWVSAPPTIEGVSLRFPPDWQVVHSDPDELVLQQSASETDRPSPFISFSFEAGVAAEEPPVTLGMSAPRDVNYAGLTGWEYHQVGLVAPSASAFIDLTYHGGRIRIAVTIGPTTDLAPQLDEILKTMQVAQ